jgi:hypothetical protein
VFVADTAPYLLYLNPFSANSADLDGRILYAADQSPGMLDLIAEHPDRTAYLQQGTVAAPETGPREDPYDLDVSIVPVEVRSGRSLTLTTTVEAPPGAAFVHLDVTTGAASYHQTAPVDRAAPTMTIPLTVAPPGTEADLATAPRGTVSVTVGWGDTAAAAARDQKVRERIVYRVEAGTLEVLLPSAKLRNELVGKTLAWRRSIALDELHVDIAP